MASDEQSLLLRLKADNAQLKATVADTRAAIATLRSSASSEFGQMQKAGESALQGIASHLNLFVGERLPLVGGAFIRVQESARGLFEESKKGETGLANFEKTVAGLANTTGKSSSELKTFLASFVNIKGDAARAEASIKMFGGATDTLTGQVSAKFIPELEAAATELGALEQSGVATAASLGSMAGPIGIAIVAILATVAAAALLTKGLFDLAVSTAEWQGKFQDMSQQLGISTETLSAFEILAKTTGGDIGSITASLGIFQKKLEEAQDPASKTALLLKSLGIETNNTEQALRQSLTVLSRMPEGFKQTATALELFGRGGKSILAILKEMGGDLDGAIAKFREMGLIVSTEDAKAADEFNDQLALLGFQARALSATVGKELIPQFLDAARSLSTFIAENRQGLNVLLEIVPAITGLSLYLGGLKGLIENLTVASQLYQANAIAFRLVMDRLSFAVNVYRLGLGTALGALIALHKEQGKPISLGDITGGAEGVKSPELEKQSQQIDLNTIKNAAVEAKQIATNAIQSIDQAFERGQISRREQIKQTMFTLANAELEQQKAIQAQIDDLERQKASAVNTAEVEKKIDDARVQARTVRRQLEADLANQQKLLDADQSRQRLDNLHKETDALLQLNARQLQILQNNAAAFRLTELDALAQTRKLTEEGFAIKESSLKKELSLAGANQEKQSKVNQQLRQLDDERATSRIDNEEKVRQAVEKINTNSIEGEKIRIDTLSRLSQIAADGSIASLKAREEIEAKARINIAEETERKILVVRLAAKDAEIEATKARVSAAGGIRDPIVRAQEQKKLNAEIDVLTRERVEIEAQGERDIDAGHQRDIDNEAKWAEELLRIKKRVNEIERESAQTIIGLMILHRANRIDILNAQIAADRKAEGEHHKEIQDAITVERQKGRDEKELHKLEEAEAERHRLALELIEDQAAKDKARETPLGRAMDSLRSGQLAELEGGIKSFQDVATVAFSAVLAGVNQLAQGVGALVQNWVLMGETGPNAFRKLAASILASVAQQAAVLAIMSLAYAALATTAVGAILLGGTPTQFLYAAAMFGAVAVGAAVAGRLVAGNSFKQAGSGASGSGSSSGSGRSGSSSSSTSTQPQTINMGRQQAPVINLHLYGDIASDALRVRVISSVVGGINDNHPQLTAGIRRANR